MNLTVRDAARIVALLDAGSLQAGREDPTDPAPYLEALAEIDATPGACVLVAEADGEVVGVCQLVTFRHLQHRGRCAELESLHVDAARRNQGIGTALVDEAARRARDADCYRLQLTSSQVRADAHRLYRRLGFVASHTGFELALR
ncbi:MAG TPA: GNAT family N-acetyltransferase [Acidimicrobiales bacterium]|nr:GNAT family N-acetyltransferase [Acidimicrobiales bacterium]